MISLASGIDKISAPVIIILPYDMKHPTTHLFDVVYSVGFYVDICRIRLLQAKPSLYMSQAISISSGAINCYSIDSELTMEIVETMVRSRSNALPDLSNTDDLYAKVKKPKKDEDDWTTAIMNDGGKIKSTNLPTFYKL